MSAATSFPVSTVLDPEIYQDRLSCPNCGGECTFMLDLEFGNGRLATCQSCGEERVELWSRVNGEAA